MRSASYDGLTVRSWGLLLDREVNASLEREPDGRVRISYTAREKPDPVTAELVEAAVRGALRGVNPAE